MDGKAGRFVVDVFLASSTFGIPAAPGWSIWLISAANRRITVNVHVVSSPRSRRMSIGHSHRLASFTSLKEIENFQKPRDWASIFVTVGSTLPVARLQARPSHGSADRWTIFRRVAERLPFSRR
jgi:hypothetical protein